MTQNYYDRIMIYLTATEVEWLHAAKMLPEQLCAVVHATPSCKNENFQAKSKLKLNKLIDIFRIRLKYSFNRISLSFAQLSI